MIRDLVFSVVLSFALTTAAGHFAIPLLHKLKFGQEVRDDGPESHLKKQGTPTMGGLFFVPVSLLVMLFFVPKYPRMLPAMLLTLGFAGIGFVDDFLKIVKHKPEGFKPLQKYICQFVLTFIFAMYLYISRTFDETLTIPFMNMDVDMGILYVPVTIFIVTATDNGSNFTDGLDGLCASVTSVIVFFLAIVSIRFQRGNVAPAAGAMLGALMGFLCYNAYPAKVFMGDTGSLALGGFVAALSFLLRIPLFIPLFAIVYLVEVLSVIIQVSYFKLTHGKRVFKMAPIHHHFELSGWSECRVVTIFTIVTVLFCFLSYIGIGGRIAGVR